ncbi:hypothetical protein M3221_00430 [Domibacillus indicus]|uniref:hypothetical protein n=1 Tax=Domibacillus indicus TaxID=1437523 RepID=UPI00203D3D3F|nr:hypothetical protein [Domibacillus indicus]MCM3786896.1 hypothetical protein [Domibacillus indicus]
MTPPHERYLEQLDTICEKVNSDWRYYSRAQGDIDKRINELKNRGDIDDITAHEMQQLLADRARIKNIAMNLLPLRDLFKGYDEMNERLANLKRYER